MKIPGAGFGITTFNEFVIIAGGGEADNSVKKIDLEKLSKEEIAPMNIARYLFSLIEMPRYNPDN